MEEHATKTYIDLTIATSIGKTPTTKFRNTNTNGTYTATLTKREMYGHGKGVKSSFLLCSNSA